MCQDTPTKKISEKIGNRMWRGCWTTSKKLFLENPSEICGGRWVSKSLIFPNNIGKSDFLEMCLTHVWTSEKAKWRSEGDDVAIRLN